jgi:flavin reductase (DIM6/NTAB) family NADH-FMN oxidoreductase RutF
MFIVVTLEHGRKHPTLSAYSFLASVSHWEVIVVVSVAELKHHDQSTL